MRPAITYDDVCQDVAYWNSRDNGYGDPRPPNSKVTLVGLLFARPELRLARDEITSSLQYFDHRSGKHINFYCAGYTQYGGPMEDYRTFGVDGWVFSTLKFDAFRQEIETRSCWRYSGDCDLLLMNACHDTSARRAALDFKSAIVCHLDAMKAAGAIASVPSLFERIFQYAEHADGNDPAWGFSDSQGFSAAGSALKRFLLSLLPKEIGKDAEKAAHFAVVDISPAPRSQLRRRIWSRLGLSHE
jgi:hypothetical protein